MEVNQVTVLKRKSFNLSHLIDFVSFIKFLGKKHSGFLPRRVNTELEGVHWKGEN